MHIAHRAKNSTFVVTGPTALTLMPNYQDLGLMAFLVPSCAASSQSRHHPEGHQPFVTSSHNEQKAEFPERIAKCSAELSAHARKVRFQS